MDAALSLVDVPPDTAGRMLVQAAGSAWVAGDAVAAAKAADHAENPPQARQARAMARLVSTDVAQWSAAVRELDGEVPASSLRAAARTVGYHLYNVYPELGVASRGELAKLDLVG